MRGQEKTKRKLIVKKGSWAMFEIGYEGGGETPDALKGHWQSQAIAEKAIKAFESK